MQQNQSLEITKVALDAMGGDYAPAEPVKGAVDAVRQLDLLTIRAKPARMFRRWNALKTLTNFTSGSPARSSRRRQHAAWTAVFPSVRPA